MKGGYQQDRVDKTMLNLLQAKINQDVSKVLGILVRDLEGLVKAQGLDREDEFYVASALLNILKEGCQQFLEEKTIRLDRKKQANQSSTQSNLDPA